MAALACHFFAIGSEIDRTVAAIVERNPALAAGRARLEAEMAAARADNVLPGLEVDFDYKFGSHENKWGAGVSQSFDWPGVYSARRKANSARASAFTQLYRADYLERALEAKQLLLNLARARMTLDVVAEAQANVARLQDLYNFAFERGETTVLEVRKLRLQAFELACRRAEAEADLESIAASLAAINGGEAINVDFGGVIPSDALGSEAGYLEQLKANDPAVAAQLSLGEVAQREVAVARRSALPSFSLGYVYENEGGDSFHGFSVGIGLPTWSNSARVASVRAQKLAADSDALDYTLRMRATISADYAAAVRLGARLEAARADFENDSYPRLLEKALDGGRINLLEYLREYNDYLDAKSAYIDIQYRYSSLVAGLNRYNLLP